MKTTKTILFSASIATLLLAGCAEKVTYVDPSGPRTLATVGDINIQDFSAAAEESTKSMIASGVLDKFPNPPTVMAVSRIINNTSQIIDTDLLTKKIRVALNQSGKVLTTTTYGLGGKAEDELAQGIQQQNQFENNGKPIVPDYSLSGKIIETRTQVGNRTQSAFTFQLSLTDKRGLAIWEGEKAIVKQAKRSSVGF